MPIEPRSVDKTTYSTGRERSLGSRPSGDRRRRMSARDLALVASFAALIVVLGIPGAIDPVGSGVPITLQTLGVMLAGSILGARRGAAACLLVVALCAVGFPVLAGGRGGMAVFASPTVGFLLAFPVSAAVIGYLAARPLKLFGKVVSPAVSLSFAVVTGGILVMHAMGVVGMMWRAHLSLSQALIADAVFIPGDLIKTVIAVVVTLAVRRAFPEFSAQRTPARSS